MGELVKDDYTNIEKLREKGIIDENKEDMMKEANGLRNRLVHEYNGLERTTAIESIKVLNEDLGTVLEDIREWLKKR